MTEDFGREDLNYYFNHVYKDRGILKWQGMFLSEHTTELKRVEQLDQEVPRLPQQSQQEIAYYLERSMKHNKVLSVQLNSLDVFGRMPPDITGVFRGFIDLETLLINEHPVALEEIRHIQMKDFQKWSETETRPFEEVSLDVPAEQQAMIDDFCEEYYEDFYEEKFDQQSPKQRD